MIGILLDTDDTDDVPNENITTYYYIRLYGHGSAQKHVRL